jgi:hypothetical protein
MSTTLTHSQQMIVADLRIDRAHRQVDMLAPRVAKGKPALVYKGRKVAVGTIVTPFWVGQTHNKYNGNLETRVGVKLNGQTIWMSADNLEPQPTDAEMERYVAAVKELQTAQREKAALEQAPAGAETDLGNVEEARLADREAAQPLSREDFLDMMPPHVAVREMVRSALIEDGYDGSEADRQYEELAG